MLGKRTFYHPSIVAPNDNNIIKNSLVAKMGDTSHTLRDVPMKVDIESEIMRSKPNDITASSPGHTLWVVLEALLAYVSGIYQRGMAELRHPFGHQLGGFSFQSELAQRPAERLVRRWGPWNDH